MYSNSAGALEETKTCLFCYDKCNNETPVPNDSQRLFERCSKYLHSAFITDTINDSPEFQLAVKNKVVPFCDKCLKSAVELSGLIEHLEFCQKSITELTFIFSLGVLHRRRKFSPNDNKSNFKRQIQEFDISALPDLENELDLQSFLENSCEQILISPDDNDDNVGQEIETPLFSQPNFENNQYLNSNTVSFGNIIIESQQNDFHQETNGNIFETEDNSLSISSPYVELTNIISKETVVVSKTDIANSPLPIVRLKRLQFTEVGTVERQTCQDEGNFSKQFDPIGLSVLQDLANEDIYNANNRSEFIINAPSDIVVNMSTMGIKFETGANDVGVNEIIEAQNGDLDEADEDYDPKYAGMENRFRCTQCRKGFRSKKMLIAHEKNHAFDRICPICNKRFSTKQALKNHKRLHTGEKPFVCPVCNKSFTVKQAMVSHQRLHTGEKPYECHVCQKRFTFQSGLFVHRASHAKEKPFQCHICKKRYPLKQTLLGHLKSHNDPNFLMKKRGRKPTLGSYSDETAPAQGPCECHVCGKILSSRNSLYVHMSVHKMSHECPICGKRFALKHSLETHVATHTGEKRYKCNLCDFSTSGANKLRYHRTTAHSKTRFQCRDCGNIYGLMFTARAHHKRVHCAIDFTDDCIITLK